MICNKCGYKIEFFFVEGEVLPHIVECPCCEKTYEVKEWKEVD